MKAIKKTLKIFILAVFSLLAILFFLDMATLVHGLTYDRKNIKYQNEHLEYLKTEYYTEEYTPCDEQKLASFDIEEAFSDDVRLNDLAVIGTHNSYQRRRSLSNRLMDKILGRISFGRARDKSEFEMDTLTIQLEHGIRNLEIDIETVDDDGDISFIVTHNPITDNISSCFDFSKALEEVALWSDNNPRHLPVYLLIEPKGEVPDIKNMQNFTLGYALELESIVRNVLGDRLLTPADAMGEYSTFEEMRNADGWPTLKECSGKIIVLLHPCNITEEYIKTDESIKSQAIFPMLRFGDVDKPYASFILENNPYDAARNNEIIVKENNLIVRTRADDYPDFSNERYAETDKCGSNIITTDFPPRTVREDEHTYSFDGYMFKLLR